MNPADPKPQPSPPQPPEPPKPGEPPQPKPPPDGGDPEAHDELVRALERGLSEMEEQSGMPQAAGATVQPVAAMPGWLASILHAAIRFLGPQLIDVIRRWLDVLKPRTNP